ncbi:MAG: ribosome maturation factor RimP [Gammaproteobacteria bacterium]|nr:ribosome maturation factor RimP [Gammaproteobacteria bacterium]
MRHVPEKLQQIVEDVVSSLGYELVGIEYMMRDKSGLLRIYIDKEQGIVLDDCRAVSHQLSGVLDVEDPIAGNYDLEISSPGMDRLLFKASDFDRFAGQRVKIKLVSAIDGRKKFKGLLQGLQEEEVVIEQDGQEIRISLANIDQARLVPEF